MSSLFSTLSMLPSHLTIEMSIALYIGAEILGYVAFRTLLSDFTNELTSELTSELVYEGIQQNPCDGVNDTTTPSGGTLCRGWLAIDRKHNTQRSTRERV